MLDFFIIIILQPLYIIYFRNVMISGRLKACRADKNRIWGRKKIAKESVFDRLMMVHVSVINFKVY